MARARDQSLLLILTLAALALLVVARIFDRPILRALNPDTRGAVDAFIVATDRMLPRRFLGIALLAGAVAWGFATTAAIRRRAIVLVVASAATNFLATTIKDLVERPRPFRAEAADTVRRVVGASGSSFPSSHASTAAAVALGCFLLARTRLPRSAWAILALIPIMVWGRIAAGVHYPTDAAAGVVLAFLTTIAVEASAHRPSEFAPPRWLGIAAILGALAAELWCWSIVPL